LIGGRVGTQEVHVASVLLHHNRENRKHGVREKLNTGKKHVIPRAILWFHEKMRWGITYSTVPDVDTLGLGEDDRQRMVAIASLKRRQFAKSVHRAQRPEYGPDQITTKGWGEDGTYLWALYSCSRCMTSSLVRECEDMVDRE
jgi:hypothetical protein